MDSNNPRKDINLKSLFKRKDVIAPLLKAVIKEYENLDTEEIIKLLEDPEDPNSPYVHLLDKEDGGEGELTTIKDLFFGAKTPVVYDLIINVEFYNSDSGFISDPTTLSTVSVIQMLLKTLQTGIFGFVYSVIYLKTHNLWNVAIFHGLCDFVTVVPNYIFITNSTRGYVASGSAGSLNILAYVIIIALMLPAGIYSYFQLKHIELPQWGLFKVKWYPLNVRKNKVIDE